MKDREKLFLRMKQVQEKQNFFFWVFGWGKT